MDIFLLRSGRKEIMGREVGWTAKYHLGRECDISCLAFHSFAILAWESWLSKEYTFLHPNPQIYECAGKPAIQIQMVTVPWVIVFIVGYILVLAAEGIFQMTGLGPDHKCSNKCFSGTGCKAIILKISFLKYVFFLILFTCCPRTIRSKSSFKDDRGKK